MACDLRKNFCAIGYKTAFSLFFRSNSMNSILPRDLLMAYLSESPDTRLRLATSTFRVQNSLLAIILACITSSFSLTSAAQNASDASLLHSSPSTAAPSTVAADSLPELFLNDAASAAGVQRSSARDKTRTGHYAMRFNRQLTTLPLQSRTRLSLPRGAGYEVVYDRRFDHASGNTTWVGHLQGYGDDYRAIVTFGKDGISGRILTPDGEFLVESNQDGEWLVDVQAAGLTAIGPGRDDAPIPPPEALEQAAQKKSQGGLNAESPDEPAHSAGLAAQIANDGSTTIDVMILYTPGLVNRFGNSLAARLDQLVALANQAYIDSGVAINLRLVHTQQVDYSDKTTNIAALNALTNGSNPALANVARLRNTYGADLVSLIRPFNYDTSGGSCGVAWLGGANGQPISLYGDLAYSVISDGNDAQGSGYYCLDLSFAHELGHNMGSAHDRANSDSQGAFSYSYGYGIDGVFGTVMSYIDPRIGKFSNPNITCSTGIACGTSTDNNALSLNNTRNDVANFKSSQTQTQPQTQTLTVTKSGKGKVVSNPTGIRCGRNCTESYSNGTSVVLTARPAKGYQFAGWGGDCAGAGASATCTVVMTATKNVSATFVP